MRIRKLAVRPLDDEASAGGDRTEIKGFEQTGAQATVGGVQVRLGAASRRVSGAVRAARRSAARVIEQVPEALRSTRTGAHGATSALQTLPDSTLRWLAASSVGLGAGFALAKAPRLAIVAGVAPAVAIGAAIALRPVEPAVPAETED